jgi:hypothetical protein
VNYEDALASIRRHGMHLVADTLDDNRPLTVIVGMDFEQQVIRLALLATKESGS